MLVEAALYGLVLLIVGYLSNLIQRRPGAGPVMLAVISAAILATLAYTIATGEFLHSSGRDSDGDGCGAERVC
jgi:hypothetical protein